MLKNLLSAGYISLPKHQKYLILNSVLLPLILFAILTGCGDNPMVDVTEEHLKIPVDSIAGCYTATIFQELGLTDRGVDILAKGGQLEIHLFTDFALSAKINIPDSIGTNYAPRDTVLSGTFLLKSDTLRITQTGTFLDYSRGHPVEFIVRGDSLETPNWSGWWSQNKIVLEKIDCQ